MNGIVHFALLLVACTKWPARHHSPPAGTWSSNGSMHTIQKKTSLQAHCDCPQPWDSASYFHHVIRSIIMRAKTPSFQHYLGKNSIHLGWEWSEGAPNKPVPSTPLQLAIPKATFCPLSLIHLTSFCGESVTANFCARQCLKRERRQSALEFFICNLQVAKYGDRPFMEGSSYSHVWKKK